MQDETTSQQPATSIPAETGTVPASPVSAAPASGPDTPEPVPVTGPDTVGTGEDDGVDPGNPDREKALSIMQVEDLINRQMTDIEKMRDEVKLLKNSYDDIFKNDAKFREFDAKAKEAAQLKKQYMQAMAKDPSVRKASEDFQRKREELKDMQIGLSDYLREYNRVSGLSQFETQDGRMLEIVQVFKLVKK